MKVSSPFSFCRALKSQGLTPSSCRKIFEILFGIAARGGIAFADLHPTFNARHHRTFVERIIMALDPEVYLNPEEAARLLRISTRTLLRWERAGKVVGFRFGPKTVRYPRAGIEGLADRLTQQHAAVGVA